MRVASIGDLHLGKMNRRIPGHMELQLATVADILTQCRELGITEIILMGDVLDQPKPPVEILHRFIEFLSSYPDMHFHWLSGNHDKNSRENVFIDLTRFLAKDHIANLTVHTERSVFQKNKRKLVFLPYPEWKPEPKHEHWPHFAHIERPGVISDTGRKLEVNKKWKEKTTYFIGHIHKPQKINRSWFTGSPYQNSFGEQLEKRWLEIKIGKDGKCKVKSHPIKAAFRLHKARVKNRKAAKALFDRTVSHSDSKKGVDYFKFVADELFDPWDDRILDVEPSAVVRSIEQVIEESEGEDVTMDLKAGLNAFLKSRELDKEDIAWCEEKIDHIIAKI